jgi:PhoPQ-activated pathogenicity-related protein
MRFVTRLVVYLWCLLCFVGEIFAADPAVANAQQTATPTPRVAPDEPSDALKQYIAKPDASYHWTKRREGQLGKGTYVELTLTSQTWRDIVWKHQLFIYKPSQIKPGPVDGILYIDGGNWKDALEQPPAPGDDKLPSAAMLISAASENAQAPVAVLLQVPHEPIFDGLREDQIISYTFAKYLETGDPEWPALLPMVKSAVRAMDTVQQYAHDNWQVNVQHFMVTGASKRGWTTWLTAASDERVNALAPMVIDMLNMGPQMAHQLLTFGGFSERIHDYTDKGLQSLLFSPNGGSLQSIVDPYSYRHHLRQPKLIMLGTNDPYWPVDALNMYWDGLEGEKHICYEPNGLHGLRDYPRMVGGLTALHDSAASGKPLPKVTWEYDDRGDSVRLTTTADVVPEAVQIWTAATDTRDFRQAHWDAHSAKHDDSDKTFIYDFHKPDHGFAALFGDLQFAGEKIPFFFSTQIRVVPAGVTTSQR